jgi:hypothetical protein
MLYSIDDPQAHCDSGAGRRIAIIALCNIELTFALSPLDCCARKWKTKTLGQVVPVAKDINTGL